MQVHDIVKSYFFRRNSQWSSGIGGGDLNSNSMAIWKWHTQSNHAIPMYWRKQYFVYPPCIKRYPKCYKIRCKQGGREGIRMLLRRVRDKKATTSLQGLSVRVPNLCHVSVQIATDRHKQVQHRPGGVYVQPSVLLYLRSGRSWIWTSDLWYVRPGDENVRRNSVVWFWAISHESPFTFESYLGCFGW
jgi:hypothetical protein